MLSVISRKIKQYGNLTKMYTSQIHENTQSTDRFETVFSFPFIKYLAIFNRLKLYQIVGSSIAVPSCGVLELLNVFPSHSFMSAAYIGLTGAGVLSLASLPFNNTIGFLYISEDNKWIKISSVDFWGKRVNRIVPVVDWFPLLDLEPKKTDIIYLSPQIANERKYKWFVKFGNVINSKKIGEVLE